VRLSIPSFRLCAEPQQIKKIALARPVDHDVPFSTWSLPTPAEFLVAEGVVDDISDEGLRVLLCEEGVSLRSRPQANHVQLVGLRRSLVGR
jgi:hypothetical protein